MKLLTSASMREWDAVSIHRDRIPSLRLMENAGRAFVRVFQRLEPFHQKVPISVVCGPGNNGGDGFVIARRLVKLGYPVRILVPFDLAELKGDALINFRRLERARLISQTFADPHVIIDALFGTGLARPLRGEYRKIIGWMNEQGQRRYAVDIPSGLNADTGSPLGIAVRADHTITFGAPKRGFFTGKGHDYVGYLHVVSIGLSASALRDIPPRVQIITSGEVDWVVRPRAHTAHKGHYGHVGVVGGSNGMMGAPLMAGYAALRAGAGRVSVFVPESAYRRIDATKLELMIHAVPDRGRGWFNRDSSLLKQAMGSVTVVALGPGLGRSPGTGRIVADLMTDVAKPLIIDADGLWWLGRQKSLLRRLRAGTLLTPHEGEMATLMGRSSAWIRLHRQECAQEFATKHGVAVLLKGYRSVLALPDGRLYLNPTGNPGMASAGQGDVLTGIYAGLMAQYANDERALMAGCFLHGLVGDLLARGGYQAVLAMDIVNHWVLGLRFLSKKNKLYESEFP